ncbi:unnamed protein product [Ectocarpus sp. 13 AM-2016]
MAELARSALISARPLLPAAAQSKHRQRSTCRNPPPVKSFGSQFETAASIHRGVSLRPLSAWHAHSKVLSIPLSLASVGEDTCGSCGGSWPFDGAPAFAIPADFPSVCAPRGARGRGERLQCAASHHR